MTTLLTLPWVWLITAGLVEIAFALSIKPTNGFTRPVATLVCLLLGGLSVYLLSRAMQGISVGTAYAVFTGIGATGVVALGIVVGGDRVSLLRLAGIAFIVIGVVVCHLAEPTS